MDDSFLTSGRKKMSEVMDLVREDLLGVQTGRAKPAMVEDIQVEAYEGSFMAVKELASITAPDPHTVIIRPWDQSVLEGTAKAIQKADLNVNPVVDKDTVRISVPSLTEERREDLVKVVKQKVEAGKAMLRQIRIDLKKNIDKQKDDAGVSEDDIFTLNESLQKLIKEFNDNLDELESQKEKELLSL